MKSTLLTLMAVGVVCGCCLAGDKPADPPAFKDETARFSYALGMSYAVSYTNAFIREEVTPDFEALLQGLRDIFYTNQTRLSEAEARQVLVDASNKRAAAREEKRKQTAMENQRKADAFLAENKSKPGIVTTDSGLQYKVLTDGAGDLPAPQNTVTVHYKASLLDGTEIDNTYKNNRPPNHRVTGDFPPGWTEAVTKMKVGSKWQVFIPPGLGYRDTGKGNVPPGALLIFEIELLATAPPAEPPPPGPKAPLTSDIIKVPSQEEMKKGAKIETIKAEDVEKEIQKQKAGTKP